MHTHSASEHRNYRRRVKPHVPNSAPWATDVRQITSTLELPRYSRWNKRCETLPSSRGRTQVHVPVLCIFQPSPSPQFIQARLASLSALSSYQPTRESLHEAAIHPLSEVAASHRQRRQSKGKSHGERKSQAAVEHREHQRCR